MSGGGESADPGAPFMLVTWNVQGANGVNVGEMSSRIRALAGGVPDVLVLQEVHRRQAAALARALGLPNWRWTFKHWPIVRGAEGLAVLTRGRLSESRSAAVTRAPLWSWRRRVVLMARITLDPPPGSSSGPFTISLVNAHLSPHDLGPLRGAEVERVVGQLVAFGAGRQALVVGDLNDLPDATAPRAFVDGGWRDAWVAIHGDEPGPTNWTEGPRVGRPPTQRLDYVLLPPGWEVDRIDVPVWEPSTGDQWSTLSDHLPVVVHLRAPRSSA